MNAFPGTTASPEALNFTPNTDERLSVVILVTYRPESLSELYEDLAAGLGDVCNEIEFIFVVEPAFIDLTEPIAELASRGEPIRILKVGQALGETSLLRIGARECHGSIILTLPAYRQVETAELGKVVGAVAAGADLAIARRWPRRDSWFNRVHTRLFHAVAARVGGTREVINDVACGVRAMRRELLDQIPLYGDLALFLPVLAMRGGYSVKEVPATQHAADQRTRLHSPIIYLRRLFDLLGLFFLLRFNEKPLRFFGALGSAVVLPGFAILGTLLVQRLGGAGIADRPLLLLGVLLVVLGIQAIALGLIGEIIVHLHAGQSQSYRLNVDKRPPEPPSSSHPASL